MCFPGTFIKICFCVFLAVSVDVEVNFVEEEYLDLYTDSESIASKQLKDKILQNVMIHAYTIS